MVRRPQLLLLSDGGEDDLSGPHHRQHIASIRLIAYWRNDSPETDTASGLGLRASRCKCVSERLRVFARVDGVMKFHAKPWTLPEGTHGYRKRSTKTHTYTHTLSLPPVKGDLGTFKTRGRQERKGQELIICSLSTGSSCI